MSFFAAYFGLSGERVEEQVKCPFPHRTLAGQEYYEENPSAQVNTVEGLFHCKACNTGHNEASFLAAVLGCRKSEAYQLLPAFRPGQTIEVWEQDCLSLTVNIPLAAQFNISHQVQQELRIHSLSEGELKIPVFMFGHLVDIRTYNPNATPKMKSVRGATAGLIVPFDIWYYENPLRWTILCAGEKDMAVARSHGLNAITLTGGEQMRPILKNMFKGRRVAIFYDNDETGIRGAIKVANELSGIAECVKVVTAFHAGMETKEDLTDYFNKYGKTRQDIITCVEQTNEHIIADDYKVPKVTLHQAASPSNIGRLLQANVQVVATSDATYTMPSEIVATKTRMSDKDGANQMLVGESRFWAYDIDTMHQVLKLVDNGIKEKTLQDNFVQLTGVPITERNVRYREFGKHTVYKVTVTDLFETASDSDTMPMEFMAYSVGHRLDSGKKYTITFKLVPNANLGQQLVMIITDVKQASDTVNGFVVTPEVIESLRKFKDVTEAQGIEGAVHEFTERIKGLLGYNGNNTLIESIDLAYHTPLEFSLGRFSKMRAYLDTIIVGESRMGKSSTAETMRKTYGLGTFVSLAGNSATTAGLIGGSNKVQGSFQTKAGIIPQNHKGLMIFEEFGKCSSDIVSELTDIRSSNEVRITRVSGTLTLPAMVRMITLSNVKTLANKDIRSIASYPNGISVIIELVGSAEDIARYDIMLVLGDKGNTISDPYWQPLEPYAEVDYRNRIRWVWSRSVEQIIIPDAVGHYIFEQANMLNQHYDSHIKIFGTEAWKKLARVAIAVAGYTVSTDDFESIVVRPEHVDYAVAYMTRIYDNTVFKLRQYVEHERKYSSTDADAVQLLQSIYSQAPSVIQHLEQEHKTSKAMIAAASGLSNEMLSSTLNSLVSGMFVKLSSGDIIPTERFRLTTPGLERNMFVRRLGDINGNTTVGLDRTQPVHTG